jgi:hypothetical protein
MDLCRHYQGTVRAVASGSSVRATAISIDYPAHVSHELGVVRMAVSHGRLQVDSAVDVSLETRGSLVYLSSYLRSVLFLPPSFPGNVSFTISMSYEFSDGYGASSIASKLFLEPLYSTRTASFNQIIVVDAVAINSQPVLSLQLPSAAAGGLVFPFAEATLSDSDAGADIMILSGSCSCGYFVAPRLSNEILPDSSAQVISGQNSSFVISGPLSDVQLLFKKLGMSSDTSCKSAVKLTFSDSGGPSKKIASTTLLAEILFSFQGVLLPPSLDLPYPSEAVIIGIAVPALSQNGRSIVKTTGVKSVWSTAYESFSTKQGLGLLLSADPTDKLLPLQPAARAVDTVQPIISEGNQDDWVLHDTTLISPLVPDPLLARIDFVFSHQVVLTSMKLIQTKYAITSLEVLVGNSDESMSSLGTATTSASTPYRDGQVHSFSFTSNTLFASRVRVVFRTISSYRGWAIYRAFPQYNTPLHQVENQIVLPRLLMIPCGKEMTLSKLSVISPDEGVDVYSDQTLAKSQNLLELIVRTSKGAFFLTALPGEARSIHLIFGFMHMFTFW